MTGIARPRRPFNSPLEVGLRAVFLLDALRPTRADIQRLVFYDYLCLHSDDAGGPPSIHPPLPHRSGEWLVRREMLSRGLSLMFAKELVELYSDATGLTYGASDLTGAFISHLASTYADALKQRASWVAEYFGHYSDTELLSYMRSHVTEWGAEFTSEALFHSVRL